MIRGRSGTPGTRSSTPGTKCEENERSLCEWKMGLYGLVISICVITTKLLYTHRAAIHDTVYQMELVTYESIAEDGQVLMRHTWEQSIRHSNLWLPLLCGFLATYFTWMVVYLDSNVPGVEPPSPFSPGKFKRRSGHSFHLNYMFSVVIGVLVTGYMYFNGIHLQH